MFIVFKIYSYFNEEADTLEDIISKLFLSFLDDKIELFQNHDIIEMDIA